MGNVRYDKVTTVPVRDFFSEDAPIVFLVDVYGASWRDLCVVPGGSAPMRRAVERLGLDPERYQASIFDLCPECDSWNADRRS